MVLFMEDSSLQHGSDTNGFVSTGSSANCYRHWAWLGLWPWPSLWDLGAMFFLVIGLVMKCLLEKKETGVIAKLQAADNQKQKKTFGFAKTH